MAAAIFFVSGVPCVGALSFFVPLRGVRVWGFGFSGGVLRACVGVCGVYTKSQGYKAPGIFTLI